MAHTERYNGWTNHATWNVALWIGNDQGLYEMARDAVWAKYRRSSHNDCPTDLRVEFCDFVEMLHRDGHITDRVAESVTLDSGRKNR